MGGVAISMTSTVCSFPFHVEADRASGEDETRQALDVTRANVRILRLFRCRPESKGQSRRWSGDAVDFTGWRGLSSCAGRQECLPHLLGECRGRRARYETFLADQALRRLRCRIESNSRVRVEPGNAGCSTGVGNAQLAPRGRRSRLTPPSELSQATAPPPR